MSTDEPTPAAQDEGTDAVKPAQQPGDDASPASSGAVPAAPQEQGWHPQSSPVQPPPQWQGYAGPPPGSPVGYPPAPPGYQAGYPQTQPGYPPGYPQPQPGYPPNAGYPGGYWPAPMPPKSSNATASLTWGLIAAIGGFLLYLPGLAGIGAIITGNRAKREIAASEGRLGGGSDATTGIVLGWVGIGIFAFWTLLWVGMVVFIFLIAGAASTAAVN